MRLKVRSAGTSVSRRVTYRNRCFGRCGTNVDFELHKEVEISIAYKFIK